MCLERERDLEYIEYLGHPVYITTRRWQKRKHRKRRINKKWAKRYGYHELDIMPHNQVVITEDGTLWMTYKTWKDLQKGKSEGTNEKEEN